MTRKQSIRHRKRYRCLAPVVLLLLAAGFFTDSLLIHAKAVLAQYLIKDAWQRTLDNTDKSGIKPWPWADTWPVARLQALQYGIDSYVLNGAQGNALAFGPGYVQGSAPPGSNGATIIGGHRDTHFRFMRQLQPGDTVLLTNTEGRSRRYRVVTVAVVDSQRQPLYADHRQAQLILVTCYPFIDFEPGGPLRYVARAVAIANS